MDHLTTLAVLALLVAFVTLASSRTSLLKREQDSRGRKAENTRRLALIQRVIGWSAILLFVGIILWSLWFETLLPFVKQKNYAGLVLELGGFALAWFGAGLVCYGAFVIVRNAAFGLALLMSKKPGAAREDLPKIYRKGHTPSEKAPSPSPWQARKESLIVLWTAWKPALRWMVLGWIGIALGGLLLRLAEWRLSY
jgi:hypothetical protein